MLNTPVLFLIFNRPDHTKKVFAQIRSVKPAKIFIAADGPRTTHPLDEARCKQTRDVVLQSIDWPCEVKTLFRDTNLGCGRAPAEAITWFFDQVEEGIILEDDCFPDATFFSFCETLLGRYRDQPAIMHISGNNFQNGITRGDASYYFSAYNHNWGWATWRSRWRQFDFSMSDFNAVRLAENLKTYGFGNGEVTYWLTVMKKMHAETPHDVWDYQWGYAIWKNGGLSILPNENLVRNIGFGPDATHTKTIPVHEYKTHSLTEVSHPHSIRIDWEADRYSFEKHFNRRDSLWRRFKNRLILNAFVRWLYDTGKKLNTSA